MWGQALPVVRVCIYVHSRLTVTEQIRCGAVTPPAVCLRPRPTPESDDGSRPNIQPPYIRCEYVNALEDVAYEHVSASSRSLSIHVLVLFHALTVHACGGQ
jgi:hypothetical protein